MFTPRLINCFQRTTQNQLAATAAAKEQEDFVGAKFYHPHAHADGNYRIRIKEKILEFSSTVLRAPSTYLQHLVTPRLNMSTTVSVIGNKQRTN